MTLSSNSTHSLFFWTACTIFGSLSSALFAESEIEKSKSRILSAIEFLASDSLKGRAIGTKEIDRAAKYIAEEFHSLGLQTQLFDGSPFQTFPIAGQVVANNVNTNRLTISNGEDEATLGTLGTTFQPLALGTSSKFDLPLVFAGYGITDKKSGYDDYADLDVRDKAVLILRKEPQVNDKNSVFNGAKPSSHAYFNTKVKNAVTHGAKAVLLINNQTEIDDRLKKLKADWHKSVDSLAKLVNDESDSFESKRKKASRIAKQVLAFDNRFDKSDQILDVNGAGRKKQGDIPVLFCQRSLLEKFFQATFQASIADVEKQIDEDLQPRSGLLDGISIRGETEISRDKVQAKNVLAVLEGVGPKAEETVIVGAHYDHVGMGGPGSLAPWTREVHNGADDNASGVSAMLEVARRLNQQLKPPHRRIVFIAFSGEETGLLGSDYYVKHPRFPLETTVAMLNLDMVGRLSQNNLQIHGTKTASEFESMVDRLGEDLDIKIQKKPGGNGPSDHASFNRRRVPVLHFFTGLHDQYHRPADDVDLVDIDGVEKVVTMFTEFTSDVATSDASFKYLSSRDRRRSTAYLGVRLAPVNSSTTQGARLLVVVENGPAQLAGLQLGDMIVEFNGQPVSNQRQLIAVLSKLNPNDEVDCRILREKAEQTLKIKLGTPR